MKIFIKIILILVSSTLILKTASGQIRRVFDCNILESLFKDKFLEARLFNSKYKDNPLILVDTGHFFKNCSLPPVNGRQIVFVNDSAAERSKRPFNFVIYRMGYSKKIYDIGLESECYGRIIYYKFKKRKGHYVLFEDLSGSF